MGPELASEYPVIVFPSGLSYAIIAYFAAPVQSNAAMFSIGFHSHRLPLGLITYEQEGEFDI